MNNYKLLAALSYFSIFFAPFLLPLIIFFISTDEHIKQHAKRAFLSHLIPIGAGILVFISISTSFIFGFYGPNVGDQMFSVWLIFMVIYGILTLAVTIWNVVQGIRVLR